MTEEGGTERGGEKKDALAKDRKQAPGEKEGGRD